MTAECTPVAFIEDRPGPGPGGWARCALGALSAAAWALAALALMARADLVALQVDRGAAVDPGYRGVAVAAAMTFGGLGYGALLASLQLLGRLGDRMLSRMSPMLVPVVACRVTVDLMLVATLAADLLRDVDTARLGTALPPATVLLVAAPVFLAHRGFRRSVGIATNVLAGSIAVVIGGSVLVVLGV